MKTLEESEESLEGSLEGVGEEVERKASLGGRKEVVAVEGHEMGTVVVAEGDCAGCRFEIGMEEAGRCHIGFSAESFLSSSFSDPTFLRSLI